MFDQQTIDLIQTAPPLEGLDLNELPKDLTRAYSTIVSLRMRLRESINAEVYDTELGEIVRRLQAIALTQEAFVAVAPDRENRAAAAFVAATAHQLRFSAKQLLEPESASSYLGTDAIAPEIAATILFLIAGRAADAAQMARNIRLGDTNSVEDYLCRAIVDLAQGRLEGILERDLEQASALFAEGSVVGLLWLELLVGLRALAARLIGRDDLVGTLETLPAETFLNVREIAVQEVAFGNNARVFSVFSGPHHLASLLHGASADLTSAGIINVTAPPSLSTSEWRSFLRRLARKRPYLWPNHREAIAKGYLTPGTSVVLSFPTGAGKSTLAELKIGAARIAGKKVVFLAPTLALVNQVATDVRRTFPETETTMSDELEPEDLKSISVMTPERCLTLLGFNPKVFEEVGLLVFDECHLMHPREGSNRRSVDAMLCLLAFIRAVPGTEVLLISAMISNAPQLASWLAGLTGRPALALTLSWKPTRQARGCVVYPSDGITALNALIKQELSSPRASISAKVKKALTARPHGMFSLFQTWKTRDEHDYALLPLLDEPILLDAAKQTFGKKKTVYLTPNRNAVAAAIAARSGDIGVKTLVFAQTIPFCTSIQRQSQVQMQQRTIQPTQQESELFGLAAIELGGQEHSYCAPGGLVACHHGLLLPVERQLNESLFRREDGVNVLVATSTLAQGMNLPGQMVVIAGDDRFDLGLEKMALLEAHELLNAAGRAGRAGEAAEGMVVLVPGKVIAYDELKTTMTKHWFDLQKIFANSDQCLELEDPLQPILDRIHAASTANDPEAAYLLRRLPLKIGHGEESARELLGSSFGAFKANSAGDQQWIQDRIKSALENRQQLAGTDEQVSWEDELSATTGILGPESIRSIAAGLRELHSEPIGSVGEWVDWGLNWLADNIAAMRDVFRPLTVQGVFGKRYQGFETDEVRARALLATLRETLPLWIGGSPLNEIDKVLTGKEPKKCDAARDWSLRLAPEVAYFCGVVIQTYRRMREEETGLPVTMPLAFAMHGRCVREGFDHPDKLALHQAMGAVVPRVAVHRHFRDIEDFLRGGPDYEKWGDAVNRVQKAERRHRRN